MGAEPSDDGGEQRRGARGSRVRLDYLELACSLASEPSATPPAAHFAVSHVTLASVAAAAGVSRAALYRLWPSQQDFWNELIDHLLDGDASARIDGATADDPVRGQPSGPVVDAAQDVLISDPLILLRCALASYPGESSASARLAIRQADRLDRLADALTTRMTVAGSRCRPGITAHDLATALTAVGSGLPVIGRLCRPGDLRFDSPVFETNSDGARSMLAVVTESIQRALTEPGDAVDDGWSPRRRDGAPTAFTDSAGRRRAYLDLAARLAMIGGEANHALGHVNLASVARAAGVSRRALGKLWPDQSRFHSDLFIFLLTRERNHIIDALEQVAAEQRRALSDSETAFLRIGEHLHRQLLTGRRRRTFMAFAPQLLAHDLAMRATDEHARLIDACAAQLVALLGSVERRVRVGVTPRHLATALFILSDGFSRLLRTHPDAVPATIATSTADRTLVAVSTAAILDRFSEPFDPSPEARRIADLIS